VSGSVAISRWKSARVDSWKRSTSHELLVVPLQDAEQVGDVAGEVVDRLGRRHLPAPQEDAAHADEGLGIEPVRDGLDPRHQAGRQVALAADVAGRRPERPDGTIRLYLHDALQFRRRARAVAGWP
jgi:hypothetical protein